MSTTPLEISWSSSRAQSVVRLMFRWIVSNIPPSSDRRSCTVSWMLFRIFPSSGYFSWKIMADIQVYSGLIAQIVNNVKHIMNYSWNSKPRSPRDFQKYFKASDNRLIRKWFTPCYWNIICCKKRVTCMRSHYTILNYVCIYTAVMLILD